MNKKKITLKKYRQWDNSFIYQMRNDNITRKYVDWLRHFMKKY